MAIRPCPNPSMDCPFFEQMPPSCLKSTQEHGCFSDLDHIVPQRYARAVGATALEKTYILDYPGNHQQLCRWEHEEKTFQGDEPLPDRAIMRQRLAQAVLEGIMVLSGNKRKQIFGSRNKDEIRKRTLPKAA